MELDFYLELTEHPNILPVQKDTKDYQIFPSFKTLNLSLDTSSISDGYRFKVEFYLRKSSKVVTIRVFGYETDDYNEIEKTQGRELEKLDENNEKITTYKKTFYILKDSSKLKKVILKIILPDSGEFGIKYGEEEFYYGNSVFASIMLGLGLSLPNLIVQIYRHIYKQRTAPWYSLILNIILHLAYGNLLSLPFHIGGGNSLIIGLIFSGIYLFCFMYLACYSCSSPKKYIFNQLSNSLKEFEELPIFQETLDFNRKIRPKLMIKVNSGHIESREVLKEYQPYIKEVYTDDIKVWDTGKITIAPQWVNEGINFDHVDSHYSEWKRVDEGGGKIEGNPGDSHNSFAREIQKREIKTWNKESEYK